jgi:hypothetical protein
MHMLKRPHSVVGLMLTVPFALLINSSGVSVTTHFWQDGTVLRQVQATAPAYFRDEGLPKWTQDVDAGGHWQHSWRAESESDGTASMARNFIVSRLPGADGSGLHIEDVFQNPLSIYTTYTFEETVDIHYHNAPNPVEADAGGHVLSYEVQMPGAIVDAGAQPRSKSGAPEIDGCKARLLLDASVAQHKITVVAKRIRWMYLVIVAYVLGFVLYKGIGFVRRNIKSKPKRI